MELIERKDPVIVLGVHRSGTSLLAELLSDLGVFMGRKRNAFHEAWHFLKNNKELLRISHADWDFPQPFHFLLNSELTREEVIKRLRSEVSGYKLKRHYFGLLFSAREQMNPSNRSWGWKDPRTSITFPLWLEMFPDARFLMIVRNGVDVASSMEKREQLRLQNIRNEAVSTRCQDLKEAFNLWEEYNEFIILNKQLIPESNFLIIRFEDLLLKRELILKEMADFLKIKYNDTLISSACNRIIPQNANRYLNDAGLMSFYNEVKDTHWMKHFGYS